MSSFTTPLIVSPLPDGRRWKLMEEFVYRIGSDQSEECVRVPAGFETDFASVPRIFWFLPDWATYNKSAPLHDWLYHNKKIMGKDITRKEADFVFLEAMLVDFRHHRSRRWVARLEYWMVRLFGWLAWNSKST